jgi:hypothetical protein
MSPKTKQRIIEIPKQVSTQTEQRAIIILSKIDVDLRNYIDKQLSQLSFEELQVLMRLFCCSLEDLSKKIFAHKTGHS